jgi:preprotein translocase subunit SecF
MIDVLRYRTITAFLSAAFFVIFFGFVAYRWKTTGEVFRYSIDFTGGVQVLLRFEKPVSALAVKDILDKNNMNGVAVREFGDNEILVRIKLEEIADNLGSIANRIQQTIQNDMPDQTITILQSETVGPEVGGSLREKSTKAVIFSMIAILIYIAFRFWSFGFAVGAVVALFHDAMMMLAVFLFCNREISINVIGAILAVMGYSINDTIVIFSQIRDNLKKMTHESLDHIVTVSINQTLRRTVLTSFATALTVGAMLLIGGEPLRDFSLALLVGIVVGTYSSIYIASPVMMLLYRR